MITKFKLFEIIADKVAPNFNIGDKVICINNENMEDIIHNGEVYTIKNIEYSHGFYFCDLIETHNISDGDGQFACTRFISEIEVNANKYNI